MTESLVLIFDKWCNGFASWLQGLSLNKRYAYSFLLGALGALAYPPVGLYIAIFITVPAYLLILRTFTAATKKSRFAVGWWFGFGHFLAALYWIANALFVDFAKFFWLYPIALFGIPAIIALYHGLISLLTTQCKKSDALFVSCFAGLWILSELIRGKMPILAFPWSLIGHAWSLNLEILQITYHIGIYGLSALTIIAVCLIYLGLRKNLLLIALPILTFAAVYKYGNDRLKDNPTIYIANSPQFRLIQPGIKQEEKWVASNAATHFKELLRQSGQAQVIIWPESAITFLLDESPEALAYIKQTAPNSILITGTTRRVKRNTWYNSIVVVEDGCITAVYDKFHLVPFGEYVPFRAIIPNGVTKITYGETDYSPGCGPITIKANKIPAFSPLVCFESAFSGEVLDIKNRPQWLLNLTNDAWYGNSAGPYQNLYYVRIRAIEEGMPLVRSANTGISAVIDAYGRILQSLPYGVKGELDFKLPRQV